AKAVIIEPAKKFGIGVEKQLVDALLQDLRDRDNNEVAPSQLQLVCLALYSQFMDQKRENSDQKNLTLAMYESQGKTEGILQGHLRRVLDRSLSKKEQVLARQLLITLVSSDHRRIRLTKSKLVEALAIYLTVAKSLEDQFDALIGKLVDSRLLNVDEDEETNEPAYELAHDLLLNQIELDPETQARKAAEELLKQEVGAFKRYETLLPRDKFDIINSQRNFLKLDNDSEELLRLSQTALEQERQEKEAQQRQALEAAQQAAKEAEARREAEARQIKQILAIQQQRRLVVGLLVILLLSVGLIFFVNRQLRFSQARQLAANAVVALDDQNVYLSTLLALEARKLEPNNTVANNLLGEDIPGTSLDYILSDNLTNHTDRIWNVAWRPDGAQLASGGVDKTTVIWDVESDTVAYTLKVHTDTVTSVAWHPNEDLLAMASDDHTIRIWDTNSYEVIRTLKGHTDGVTNIAWHPEGKRLASGSRDSQVFIWNAETGAIEKTLSSFSNTVWNVAWRPDGKQLAASGVSSKVLIWDMDNGGIAQTLTSNADVVYGLSWHPERFQLASTSENSVIIWDTVKGEIEQTLSNHSEAVWNVAWHPDGSKLASGSVDKSVVIWNMEAKRSKPIQTLQGHTDAVTYIAWHPAGTRLASAAYDRRIQIWDMFDEPTAASINASRAVSIAWQPGQTKLASGSVDHTVTIWETLSRIKSLRLREHQGTVHSVAWHPSETKLASGSADTNVIVWNVESGRDKDRVEFVLQDHTDVVRSVAWHPNGTLLASGSDDNKIIIWDAERGEPIGELPDHTGAVRSVAWHPDGMLLASGSDDKTIIIWDVNAKKALDTLTAHTDVVRSVAWHPDGMLLASGSDDNSAIVWAWQDDRASVLERLKDHDTHFVTTVAWHPTDSLLASGGEDASVVIWDTTTWLPIQRLTNHSETLLGVAWRPDGTWLATVAADQAIYLTPKKFAQDPCQWWDTKNLPVSLSKQKNPMAVYAPTCSNLASTPIPFGWTPNYLLYTHLGRLLTLTTSLIILLIVVGLPYPLFRWARSRWPARQHSRLMKSLIGGLIFLIMVGIVTAGYLIVNISVEPGRDMYYIICGIALVLFVISFFKARSFLTVIMGISPLTVALLFNGWRHFYDISPSLTDRAFFWVIVLYAIVAMIVGLSALWQEEIVIINKELAAKPSEDVGARQTKQANV
ncbi:MAG: hypothetical protein AAF629_23355, partial [Chloroflexota bacterium]